MAQVIYLEYSEEAGTSHKFYEITVSDEADVSINYGRIGESGVNITQSFPSYDEALKFANKKANSKKKGSKNKKGYQEAVKGVRQFKKRTIVRRNVESQIADNTLTKAPILWKMNTGSSAFGIYVDSARVWVGNQNGSIFVLNHKGEVCGQHKLTEGIKCLVSDGQWVYAGCDDGNVYDITESNAKLAYTINEDVNIFWMDINSGRLVVSDADGNVVAKDFEGEDLLNLRSTGQYGWMVRSDDDYFYHGTSQGITCYSYSNSNNPIWFKSLPAATLFGWQEKHKVYAGLSDGTVVAYDKNGSFLQSYKCGRSAIYSNATSEDGKLIFAGDSCSTIYCFESGGKLLWKMNTTCGSALSMQYFNNRLYIVTSSGYLASIDVSETVMNSLINNTILQGCETINVSAPTQIATSVTESLETTANISQSDIVLKCVKVGSRLRVKVESEGYNSDYYVQFPNNLRSDGARFAVTQVVKATNGDFYRVVGGIKKV
jgi:outer membrane protein assembly factor BamB/predicted DNA-binding WGR domain protein